MSYKIPEGSEEFGEMNAHYKSLDRNRGRCIRKCSRASSPGGDSSGYINLESALVHLRAMAFWMIVLLCMGVVPAAAESSSYMIGADVSFLAQAEQKGIVFRDNGVAKPGLQILKDHGYNWIRLRIFNSPTGLPNDLVYTISEARAARKLGFKFLLDFHYSDDWADPAHQIPPKVWEAKTHQELASSVFEYTRDTIAAFRDAGVPPDMVQIGNEVTAGILWPDGKLPEYWDRFAELIRAGIRGVEAGSGSGARPEIMIHIDQGGDSKVCKWFLDKLNSYNIAYDIIGLSYYPWWHGSVQQLSDNLAFLANEYHKNIVVVETAYNWIPGEYVGKPAPFPESPEGQQRFLTEVNRAVRQTPGGYGKGLFWWEPAVEGHLESRGLFDRQRNALPALTVFDRPAPHRKSWWRF